MKRLAALFAALILAGTGLALAQEYVATPVTVSKEKVRLNGKVFLSHVVLERQTLYGISQAYGVSVDEIQEANPSLKQTGLQKNSIILVPYREKTESVAEAAPQQPVQQAYTEHTVRWYEDIDDIARKYNVSVRDIMEYNKLKSRKLSTRQVLRIPLSGSGQAGETETQSPESQPQTDALPETPDTLGLAPEVPAEQELVIIPKESVEMALILPLQAGSMNMDFYSGVLMALKDIESEGIRVHAHVYDLTAGIPQADILARCDFVLGPVTPRDLEAVLQRTEGRVPVISPMDQKAASLADNYPNLIQAPSAAHFQYNDLCEWIKQDMKPQDKIILITEKSASNVTAPASFRTALADQELPYEILSYAIIEGRGIPATLSGMMTQTGVNRLIVASESEAFMGDVMRNIGIMLGKGYDVVMYAPSKVRTFDTIDGSAYHDASMHLSTAYFADYSSERVNRFVRSYRALFQTEPNQFAFQGYDTAWYFLTACARYGDHWQQMVPHWRCSGLHTDFLLEPNRTGNLKNTAVRRIVYQKNYTTTLEP